MPGPYSPPNPYGAYFAFGQPEGLTAQSFNPMPFGTMSPGAGQMTGQGSGGMNPSPFEYLTMRTREFYHQQFLSHLARTDPRAQTLTTALLSQMGNQAQQQSILKTFGGRGNLSEMVGTALSFPGISGMLGGSALALGQGAYAMASSGMGINGSMMMGDGPMQLLAARAITSRLTNQFYTSSGAANTTMTSGLNRDQLGGVMMMGASQGAFAGMNMGSLTKIGNATTFGLDENTMTKIAQFTKSAAKALSNLIDIYGDASVAELASKAHQITGLDFSRVGNAQIMANRLSQIRTAAGASGLDPATAMDLAASGTTLGIRMGMSPVMAGQASARAIGNSAVIYQGFKQGGNLFDMASPSLQEIQAGQVRDQAGIMRDPVGIRRLALQSAISHGHLTGTAADEARSLMKGSGMGMAHEMDIFMNRRAGLDMRSYIEMMGGVTGLQKTLGESQRQELLDMNEQDVSDRASRMFRMKLGRTLRGAGIDGAGLSAMTGLVENLRTKTLTDIFAAGKFDEKSVRGLLSEDTAGSLDIGRFSGMVKTAFDQFGSDASAKHKLVESAKAADPFLAAHSAKMALRADQALARNNLIGFDNEERGFMRSGFFDSLLNRMKGNDPRSNWVRAMRYSPEGLHGWKQDWSLPTAVLGPDGQPIAAAVDQMKKTLSAMSNDTPFSTSANGADVLKELGISRYRDPANISTTQAVNAFTKMQGGLMGLNGLFRNYTISGGLGGNMMLGDNTTLDRMKSVGSTLDLTWALAQGYGAKGDYQTRNQLLKVGDILRNDPERVDQAVKVLTSRSKDIDFLSRFSDKQLQSMVPTSEAWSKEMISYLDATIKDGKLTGKQLASAKHIRDVMATAGATNREDTSKVTRIEGDLQIVGQVLHLKDGKLVVNESRK